MSSFNHFSPFAKRAGNFWYSNFDVLPDFFWTTYLVTGHWISHHLALQFTTGSTFVRQLVMEKNIICKVVEAQATPPSATEL